MTPTKNFIGVNLRQLTRTDVSAGSQKDGEFTNGTREKVEEVEDIAKKVAQGLPG